MSYAPPRGWIEPAYQDDSGVHIRFHARRDCPRIKQRDQLRAVDRPFSAHRCSGCADAYGNNRETFSR